MERREKDFQKIDNIEKVVVDLANDVKTHIKVDEMSKTFIKDKLEDLSSDIKEQRQHFDGVINRNKEHFDEKINTCNREIHNKLKTDYATRSEILAIKDETILDQTKIRHKEIEEAKIDIMSRIRNYGGIIAATIILLITIISYILGIEP